MDNKTTHMSPFIHPFQFVQWSKVEQDDMMAIPKTNSPTPLQNKL